MTTYRIFKATFIAALELAFVLADAILLFGFTFFNSRMTAPTSHAGLVVMLVGDIAAFAVSWWKPRLGGMLVACISVASLILVMIGSTKDGFASLWLTTAIFWGAKGLLAMTLMREKHQRTTEVDTAKPAF